MSKREYDCEELAKIRNQVVCTTGITITNEVIGIVLAGYQGTKKKTELPQDVEEAIAALDDLFWLAHGSVTSGDHNRFRDAILILARAARPDKMSGHVRVPVEPTEAMIEAGCKQHECLQHDPWYSNDELTEYDCKAIYKAMLSAHKEK